MTGSMELDSRDSWLAQLSRGCSAHVLLWCTNSESGAHSATMPVGPTPTGCFCSLQYEALFRSAAPVYPVEVTAY